MSVEGFNLLRKRIRGPSGPYQLIVDDIDKIEPSDIYTQFNLLAETLCENPGQIDKAIVLMPPGMHLARVR